MKNRVSIYDIAEYCNLSVASVSYAINGKKKVSDETRDKVLEAIKTLGYHPNYTARTLSTGKSNLIGILLPLNDASIAFLQNPFYVEFIGSFEKEITKYNYDVVIGIEQEELELEDWIRRRTIDGLVLIGSHPSSTYEILKRVALPTVLIDDDNEESKDFNNIRSNDEEGMYNATKYLISLGHSNIGFIGNEQLYPVDNRRYQGYLRAMKEANLDVKEEYIYRCPSTFDDGLMIAEEIISRNNVSAIVCSADILAIGITKRLQQLGKQIPKDLSIIGFDDIQTANYIHPSLTSVHQDISMKGYKAAELLFDFFQHGTIDKTTIVIEPYLVERESVKKM